MPKIIKIKKKNNKYNINIKNKFVPVKFVFFDLNKYEKQYSWIKSLISIWLAYLFVIVLLNIKTKKFCEFKCLNKKNE